MYGHGSRGFSNLDPRWTEFAASLRKGQVYVKMPIAKARALGMIWHIISQKSSDKKGFHAMAALVQLITDEAQGSQTYGIKSVFYMVPVDQCTTDIEVLTLFAGEDATGTLRIFKETLEKGLQSDPEVDWIARVGGPQAHPFEGLQEDELDVSIDELFDFGDEPLV